MRRYEGQGYKSGARIAIIANDALGNFVVATPLMQMLRQQVADLHLDLYSGHRIDELASASPLLNGHYPLFGPAPRDFAAELTGAPYDYVINLEDHPWASTAAALLSGPDTYVVGRSLSADGRGMLPYSKDDRGQLQADTEWMSTDIQTRYPFLQSGHISEIFCRLAYLDGSVPSPQIPTAEPPGPLPSILVSASASLPEKLWPVEAWRALLFELNKVGLEAGILGAKPGEQSKFWQGSVAEQTLIDEGLAADLRGELTLPQVGGALSRARAVVTIDNGILHMACASGAPTIGLFRNGIHRLWAPPVDTLTVLEPGENGRVSEIPGRDVLNAVLKNI